MRIGAGAGIDRLPRVSRVVAGPDGSVHVLTVTDELIAFDRTGRLMGRHRVITEERRRAISSAEAMAAIERMRNDRIRAPGVPDRYQVSGGPYGATAPDSSRSLGWIGDSLWVATRGTETVALFRPDGRAVREIPYAPSLEGSPASVPLGLLADGSLLRTISWRDASPRARQRSMPPPPETFRMPVIPVPPHGDEDDAGRGFLLRASGDGTVLQGLEIFAEPRLPVLIRNPYGSTVQLDVPFQDHPLIAVTPDGAEVIFLERYRATRPGSASYSIARFDVTTRRRSARHHPYVPRPVTRATIDSLLSVIMDSRGSPVTDHFVYGFPSVTAARTVVEAALEIPAYHPPVAALVAGADHTLWLREHASSAWTVLGRDGAVVGTVALPSGVRLVHADAESAWGVIDPARGSDRSAVLVRYRIVKSPASST